MMSCALVCWLARHVPEPPTLSRGTIGTKSHGPRLMGRQPRSRDTHPSAPSSRAGRQGGSNTPLIPLPAQPGPHARSAECGELSAQSVQSVLISFFWITQLRQAKAAIDTKMKITGTGMSRGPSGPGAITDIEQLWVVRVEQRVLNNNKTSYTYS